METMFASEQLMQIITLCDFVIKVYNEDRELDESPP